MDFEKKVKKLKNIHLIILISFSVVFFFVWFLTNVLNIGCAVIENPQLVMALQYAGIFMTLGGLVYGYHNYSETLKKHKDSIEEAIKQDCFIKTKKVQNYIIYFLFVLNILLFVLTNQKQFELLTAVTLIVCAINFPKMSKYLEDYEISDSNS